MKKQLSGENDLFVVSFLYLSSKKKRVSKISASSIIGLFGCLYHSQSHSGLTDHYCGQRYKVCCFPLQPRGTMRVSNSLTDTIILQNALTRQHKDTYVVGQGISEAAQEAAVDSSSCICCCSSTSFARRLR